MSLTLGFNYETYNAPAHNSTLPQVTFRQSVSIYNCFWHMCTVHAHELSFLRYQKSSDISVRFSDPEVLKESNNFAIRRRLLHWTDRKSGMILFPVCLI